MIVWHWIYCCIDSGRRIEWILAQYLKYMNRASADLAQFWHSHWPLLEISMFALIIVCFMWFLKSILYFIKFRSVVPFFRLAKCTHKHMHWSNRIEKEIAWRNGDGEIRSEKERNYIAVLSFNGSDGTFMAKQRLYRYRSRAPHSLSCSCWLFFFWIHDATTCQVLCVARNGWLHSMCHSDISLHFICKGSNGYIRFAYRINVYNKACECVECVRGEMHLSLPLYCIYDIVLSFSLTKPKTYTHKLRELSKNVQQ